MFLYFFMYRFVSDVIKRLFARVHYYKKQQEQPRTTILRSFATQKKFHKFYQNATNSFDKYELISTMIAKSCVKKRKVVFCCLSCFFLETLLF